MNGKKIAILATDGFEQSELVVPCDRLREVGANVDIVSLEKGEIRGWKNDDWGDSFPVDKTIYQVRVEDYDCLVLPGGQINPDLMRTHVDAVAFIRDFFETGKPLAAICHAPWLLVEADVLDGRRVTSHPSIQTDVTNAGADWVDREVVVDNGLITSRGPDDLAAFCEKIIEEVQEERHEARRVA